MAEVAVSLELRLSCCVPRDATEKTGSALIPAFTVARCLLDMAPCRTLGAFEGLVWLPS